MIAVAWRERLAYIAMSLVIVWHCLAILVAPAPDNSSLIQALRFALQPYLSLFRLDNKWNFFAPSVGRHMQFRYVVESSDRTRHVFIPSLEKDGSIPRRVMWREFKYFYEGLTEAPRPRGKAIAPLLCQKHASLNPVAIFFVQAQEIDFSPEDYRQGHRPLDPEFVTVSTLAKFRC